MIERIVMRVDPIDSARLSRALEVAGLTLAVMKERFSAMNNWTMEYTEPTKEPKKEPVFRYPI